MDANLPFERGRTMSDYDLTGMSLDANSYLGIAGERFVVRDDQHGTGKPVTLIALKNGASDFTVARKFLKFGSAALDFGRKVADTAYNDTAGGVVVALDDAYTVGATIKAHDVFYGVLEGPVSVNTESSSVNLSAGDQVASDASGTVNGAAAAAGEFVAGTIDQDETDTSTATVIHMAGNLAKPPAAG